MLPKPVLRNTPEAKNLMGKTGFMYLQPITSSELINTYEVVSTNVIFNILKIVFMSLIFVLRFIVEDFYNNEMK